MMNGEYDDPEDDFDDLEDAYRDVDAEYELDYHYMTKGPFDD